MTAQSVLDAVRRVEEAPLKDLVGVSMEDVETQMDTLLEPEIDCASLYRRWERQQWAVSDLDFWAAPGRFGSTKKAWSKHPDEPIAGGRC